MAAWDRLSGASAAQRVRHELARIDPATRGVLRLARRVAWHRIRCGLWRARRR